MAAIASRAMSGSGLSSMAGKRTSRSLATARSVVGPQSAAMTAVKFRNHLGSRCVLLRVACAERLG
jgi:hypothetical protein